MPGHTHVHIFAPNERQKRAHYAQNSKKLESFPYRCNKELTRAFKLVRGLKQQRASKLVKNIKKQGSEKDTAIEVLAATKSMPLDILVRLVLVEDLNLKDEAVGIELAAIAAAAAATAATTASEDTTTTTTSSTASTTSTTSTTSTIKPTRKARDIILEPLTTRQRGMVQKWKKDTRIKDVVTSLSKIRVELKSKVRHMRDRLSKKEKREAYKKDPSLKPVKKPKPVSTLEPQSALYKQMLQDEGLDSGDGPRADYYVPTQKKKKNRMGQRARKKLAEEAEAAKDRGSNRTQRRATDAARQKSIDNGEEQPVLHENRASKRRRQQQATSISSSSSSTSTTTTASTTKSFIPTTNRTNSRPAKVRRVDNAPTKSTEADPSSHPSWKARSLAKEKEKNAKFTGSKVTFDDSDSD